MENLLMKIIQTLVLCVNQFMRSVSFSRDGQLSFTNLDFPFPNYFQASFGFQTFQPSGLLLSQQTQTNNLQVTLEDGHIELNISFKSPQIYTDGLLHYVSVISDNSGLRLPIDDQPLKNNQKLHYLTDYQQTLCLGRSHFEVCISSVSIQRLAERSAVLDLASKSTKRGVSLGGCSLNKPPFPMLLRGSARINKAHAFNINQPLRDMPAASPRSTDMWREAHTCLPPPRAQAGHGALRFGDSPTSHVLFTIPQELLKPSSPLAVDVRAESSRGLVFYKDTKNSYMALYLSKGQLIFALGAEGKKLRLKSKEKCNDGKWPMVVFGQDGEKGHLVVDGLRAREGSWPGNSTFSLRAPVYLGSPPSWKPKSLPQNSFMGCLRNFQLNLKPLDTIAASVAVSPCLGGPLEKGIYFSQEGGHMINPSHHKTTRLAPGAGHRKQLHGWTAPLPTVQHSGTTIHWRHSSQFEDPDAPCVEIIFWLSKEYSSPPCSHPCH